MLKSGGPVMTITAVEENVASMSWNLRCEWRDKDGGAHSHKFLLDTVTILSEPPSDQLTADSG